MPKKTRKVILIGGKKAQFKSKTRRGRSYAPKRKKRMMKRRQPFVETKTRTSEDVFMKLDSSSTPAGGIPQNTMVTSHIPKDDSFTMLELSPIDYMTQGLEEDDMVGRSIYAKYLKTKIQISWPQDTYVNPAKLYLVHGFVKLSPNATTFTTPSVTSFTYHNLREFLSNHIRDYFNEREDKLRFIPKQNSPLHISGYRQLRPNIQKQYSMPAQLNPDITDSDKVIGSIPDTHYSFNHRMMRKLHFEKGNNNAPMELYFQNMNAWLPFAVVYTPDFANNPSDDTKNLIGIRYNSILYYSDS